MKNKHEAKPKKTHIEMESQAMLISSNQLKKLSNSEEEVKQKVLIDANENRDKWSNKYDFFLSALGYQVGLSNIWRFPYLCYKYGGGAFLVAYYIGIIFGSIPMFFIEVSLGQFMNRGGSKTWKISPMFRGIGYASTVMNLYYFLYYIILMTWSMFYLFSSFNSTLPWENCNNSWNTEHCVTLEKPANNSFLNKSLTVTSQSSVEEFWKLNVLQVTDSFDKVGSLRLELIACLALAWFIVYFCIFRGLEWTGKVVYFTSSFPFFLLAIIFVRGLTLEGAWDGIKFLFKPDWNKLKSSEVWIEAVTQGFYSYGLGLGSVTMLGSYNEYKTDCYKIILMLSFIGEATCMISGLAIFSVLGFLAKSTGKDIADVAEGGPGLAFIAYPSALSQLPISPLWSVLFFLMLIFVALDGQFVCVEGFITACTDEWPKLKNKRSIFLPAVCIVCFLIDLIFVTQGGIYWFEIFNQYSCAGWAMLLMMFFECICIAYGYGVNNFYEAVKDMIGYYPGAFWKYCWLVGTPGMCLVVFLFSIVKIEPLRYEDYYYPWYGELLGWILTFSSIGLIPIFAIYKVLNNIGNIKNIIRPKKKYRKNNAIIEINNF